MFAFTLLAAASAQNAPTIALYAKCSGPKVTLGACDSGKCYQLMGPATVPATAYNWGAKEITKPDDTTVGYCLPAEGAACAKYAIPPAAGITLCPKGQYCSVDGNGTGTCTASPDAGSACVLPTTDASETFEDGICGDGLNCLPDPTGGDAMMCGAQTWCDHTKPCKKGEQCVIYKGEFPTPTKDGTYNYETEDITDSDYGVCVTLAEQAGTCDALAYTTASPKMCAVGEYCAVKVAATVGDAKPTCTAFDTSNTDCIYYDGSATTNAATGFCPDDKVCKAVDGQNTCKAKATTTTTTKAPKNASSSASKPKKATTTTTTTSSSESDGTTSDANATTADSAVSTILGGALTSLVFLF